MKINILVIGICIFFSSCGLDRDQSQSRLHSIPLKLTSLDSTPDDFIVANFEQESSLYIEDLVGWDTSFFDFLLSFEIDRPSHGKFHSLSLGSHVEKQEDTTHSFSLTLEQSAKDWLIPGHFSGPFESASISFKFEKQFFDHGMLPIKLTLLVRRP